MHRSLHDVLIFHSLRREYKFREGAGDTIKRERGRRKGKRGTIYVLRKREREN